MPQAFLSRNRARLGASTYLTVSNQGGGEKKAGFPYQIGRNSLVNIKIGITPNSQTPCCKLGQLNSNIFPIARQSRGVGSLYTTNYKYYKIPGTIR